MREEIKVRGLVIGQSPVGEYDRRVVLLTMEKGKISAFARGARRPNSQLAGVCQPMCFGTFSLYVGRDSYVLLSADMEHYFEELKKDLEKIAYGSYFLELASFLTRENNDEREILKLLYGTLKALEKGKVPPRLLRCIYEIRILTCFGEGIQAFSCIKCGREEALAFFSPESGGCVCTHCGRPRGKSIELADSVLYTLQYIITSPLEKLFCFLVSDEVLGQLIFISGNYLSCHMGREFKALELLRMLERV